MSFSTMLELLQEKNNQKVVLIKTGVFYITEPKVRKIRDKGKRKLKQKVKELKYYIREEKLTSFT